jgi:hypothetical protein
MTRVLSIALVALAVLVASLRPAHADVTVVYAPPADRAPLVARPVCPTEDPAARTAPRPGANRERVVEGGPRSRPPADRSDRISRAAAAPDAADPGREQGTVSERAAEVDGGAADDESPALAPAVVSAAAEREADADRDPEADREAEAGRETEHAAAAEADAEAGADPDPDPDPGSGSPIAAATPAPGPDASVGGPESTAPSSAPSMSRRRAAREPATAPAPPSDAPPIVAAVASTPPSPTECRSPVALVRSPEERLELPLTDCDGRPLAANVGALSILARPRTLATLPSERDLREHESDPVSVADGIRRLHPGLLERLRVLADRFPGHAIEILGGYRSEAREGSRHLHGLAIDVRVVGVGIDDVHAVAVRFDRTGVGLDRAAGFLHLDVRERSLHWIDAGPDAPPEIIGDPARPPTPIRSAAADEVDPEQVADEVIRGLRDVRLGAPAP